jgi:hypothetical protein
MDLGGDGRHVFRYPTMCLCGLTPQANYTDRATATCRPSYCQILPVEGVAWSAQRIPTAVNLGSLYPEPLFFHSSSYSVILTRLGEPVPDTLLVRK